MPIDGSPLVVEPTWPNSEAFMAIGRKPSEEEDPEFAGAKIRNSFWSSKKGRVVTIFELKDGRIDWGTEGAVNHVGLQLKTLDASDAWGVEQEGTAVQLLGTLLRHRQFKQYLMTGMFLERSVRSGITYLFRRLRPTLALSRDASKILCALCMHPIGYYEGSWAGAMCPTDDVCAHLSLMRADEHLFWRRANQHPPYRREAGL